MRVVVYCLFIEKGKYEYKQIVCGYSHYVISC